MSRPSWYDALTYKGEAGAKGGWYALRVGTSTPPLGLDGLWVHTSIARGWARCSVCRCPIDPRINACVHATPSYDAKGRWVRVPHMQYAQYRVCAGTAMLPCGLGDKAVACLRIADARHRELAQGKPAWDQFWADAGARAQQIQNLLKQGVHLLTLPRAVTPPRTPTPETDALYAAACATWSAKAIDLKFEELATRDYIEYGSSARTGWLTDKGKTFLARANLAPTEGAATR